CFCTLQRVSEDTVLFTAWKVRGAKEPAPFHIRIEDLGEDDYCPVAIAHAGPATGKESRHGDPAGEVERLLRGHPPGHASHGDLVAGLVDAGLCGKTAAKAAVKGMVQSGRIVKVNPDDRLSPYRLPDPPPG